MLKENYELTQTAREALSGKWGLAIGTFFIYILLVGGIQIVPFFGGIASLLLSGPFLIGVAIFSLSIVRKEEARLEQLFDGFNNFGNALGAYLLMVIFVFLWMLLLIIPGIIAAIAYSQTFYILAEDSSVGPMEAIDQSKEMMDGYKWKFFFLGLRFLGWAILCLFTFGIGFLWLIPYMNVSYAAFYEDLKQNSTQKIEE